MATFLLTRVPKHIIKVFSHWRYSDSLLFIANSMMWHILTFSFLLKNLSVDIINFMEELYSLFSIFFLFYSVKILQECYVGSVCKLANEQNIKSYHAFKDHTEWDQFFESCMFLLVWMLLHCIICTPLFHFLHLYYFCYFFYFLFWYNVQPLLSSKRQI